MSYFTSVMLRNNNVFGRLWFTPVMDEGDLLVDGDVILEGISDGNCDVLCLSVDGDTVFEAWTYKDCEVFTTGGRGKAKVRIGTHRSTVRKVKP